MTSNPDSARVARQARNASVGMAGLRLPARFLLRGHDGKFAREFDAVFAADGTGVERVGPVAPNLNAHAERFARTLRAGCRDHFLVPGEKHLRRAVREFVEHHNAERLHRARGNVPLPDAAVEEVPGAARRAAPPPPPRRRLTQPTTRDNPLPPTVRCAGLARAVSG